MLFSVSHSNPEGRTDGAEAPPQRQTQTEAQGQAQAQRQMQSHTPPDLNLLRTFLAVYRFGSFTAAAQALGLSQPTVTTQIRSLERQTRRELFERRPRGVAPTSVADELAARVAAPLDALAVAAGNGLAEGARAEPVHLAGPAEMLSNFALPVLGPLVAQGVRLRVTMGLTDPLLD